MTVTVSAVFPHPVDIRCPAPPALKRGGARAPGASNWTVFGIALACILVTVSSLARGAEPTGQIPIAAPQIAGVDTRAPVIVDGRVLFYVAGVSAVPATRRAEILASRIRSLAADDSYVPGPLTLRDRGDHTELLARGARVFLVYDADARLEGVERGPAAAAISERIHEAVKSYREERSPGYLRENGLYAGVAMVLLVLGLYGLRRLLSLLRARIELRYQGILDGVRFKSIEIIGKERFWASIQRSATAIWSLIAIAAVLAYFSLVLGRFPWTRWAGTWIPNLVLDPLRTMGRGAATALPGLVFILILIVIIRYGLKIARLFFAGLSSGMVTVRGFEPEWAMPTYDLVRAGTIALGLIVAFPYIPGSGSEAFKGVSIFIGVLFSLGSTSAIANTIAGYTLIYRRAFKAGDRVKIGAVTGDVIEMELQVTRIRTIKNEEIIVPNSIILNADVVNYSSFARGSGLILHTTVGIGYEIPWRQVEGMLLLAASRAPGLMTKPAPFVLQLALGDFCVTYELNAYCANPQTMNAVYTDMHRQILDVFNEYGVQIMTPAYEVDPEQPKVVPKDQWFAEPARAVPGHGQEGRDIVEPAKPL